MRKLQKTPDCSFIVMWKAGFFGVPLFQFFYSLKPLYHDPSGSSSLEGQTQLGCQILSVDLSYICEKVQSLKNEILIVCETWNSPHKSSLRIAWFLGNSLDNSYAYQMCPHRSTGEPSASDRYEWLLHCFFPLCSMGFVKNPKFVLCSTRISCPAAFLDSNNGR